MNLDRQAAIAIAAHPHDRATHRVFANFGGDLVGSAGAPPHVPHRGTLARTEREIGATRHWRTPTPGPPCAVRKSRNGFAMSSR